MSTTLDEAWAACEAALPEGWSNGPTLNLFAYDLASGGRHYLTWVEAPHIKWQRYHRLEGNGLTPIAALDALTAKLRERQP